MLNTLQYLALIALPLLYFAILDITGRGKMKVMYLIPIIAYSITAILMFGFAIQNLFQPYMTTTDLSLLIITCFMALVFGFLPNIGGADKALFLFLLIFAPVFMVVGIVTIAIFINIIFKHKSLKIEKDKSIFAPYLLLAYILFALLIILLRL